MTSASSTSHTWYLDADDYYVPTDEASAYPVRQGDLFPANFSDIKDWHACQLIHPTCELGKASVEAVQVIRAEPLARVESQRQQAEVVAGFAEKGGTFRPAFAHTFFLPPYTDAGLPMFSNFREVAIVPQEDFTIEHRLAAITHDARVTFIRRKIYFRYRIALTFDDVQKLEARRISNDAMFQGPRPPWGAAPE